MVGATLMAAALLGGFGGTAPAYPGNSLQLSVDGPLVAGTVVKVGMSGHADWKGPTDDTTTPYDLALFVQNADVVPHCAQSYSAQLQASINLNLNASTAISGFVVSSNQHVAPKVPDQGLDWAGDSLPFSIKPGLDHVILCGYVRYVIDDVAWYELPVTMRQPACRASRAVVRRGTRLELKCNVSGPAKVKFSGPRSRTVQVRISAKDGRVRVPLGSLRAGRYRVTVASGALPLGRFSIRVR